MNRHAIHYIMGNDKSKESDPQSVLQFSDQEQEYLKKLYNSLCGEAKTIAIATIENHLKSCLPKTFCEAILFNMTADRQRKTVGLGLFAQTLGHLFKARHEERVSLIIQIASPNVVEHTSTTSTELVTFMVTLVQLFFKAMMTTSELKSWNNILQNKSGEKLAHFLLRDLFYPGRKNKEKSVPQELPIEPITESDIENWLMRTPLIIFMMDSAFYNCFPVLRKPPYLFPECTMPKKSNVKTMLDFESVLGISSYLPQAIAGQWRQLFNSVTDGQSFSRLVDRISKEGPTLLVIKDEDGHIFGGFASQDWTLSAKFQGTSDCFLFKLDPVIEVYTATGYNDHYFYLNQNQQTFPNGVGFGGQVDYFGVFLSSEYGNGICAPTCTTYNCPQLAKSKRFKLKAVEVWGVGPVREKTPPPTRVSVLDKENDARALLEMSGKTRHSDGLREPEEEEGF